MSNDEEQVRNDLDRDLASHGVQNGAAMVESCVEALAALVTRLYPVSKRFTWTMAMPDGTDLKAAIVVVENKDGTIALGFQWGVVPSQLSSAWTNLAN